MTIKEVEQVLGVPRATIRFYEKEGLIAPQREESGYRSYSEADVNRLKQIIILRKLGIAVTDIAEILRGTRPLSEVVANNIENLEKQMQEIKGAILVCQRIQENQDELESFEPDKYWNVIEEEENKGNRFMDIAKDVVHYEKATILEFFGLADINGNLAVGIPKAIGKVVFLMVVAGLVKCCMRKTWALPVFFEGVDGVMMILLLECTLGLPVYFLGKKYPQIAKHKNAVFFGLCVVLILVLLLILMLFPDS